MEAEIAENDGAINRSRWIHITAVVVCVLVTLAFLPYSWGRVLIATLLVGAPEPLYTALLVLGIVAVWGLSCFARRGLSRRGMWIAVATVSVLWIAANAIVAGACAGPFFPRYYVVPGYTLGSLWVLWLAWLFVPPISKRSRFIFLAVFMSLGVAFLAVFEVEGLMGGDQVNFTWRKLGESTLTRPSLISASKTTLPDESDAGFRRDYPQYLGPTRTASLPDVRLNLDWSTNPPQELWRRSVGAGWSSFAVSGGFAVTQEQRGENECVVCYGLRTGEDIWNHTYRARYHDGYGGAGPRATPTIDSDQVFAIGATGVLSCLDLTTGEVHWSKDVLAEHDASNQTYGVCCSPLVSHEMVIVCPTGESGPTLVAYHRDTGERVWQAGTDQASYSSPILADIDGIQQVIVFSSSQAAAFDFATGDALWKFAWSNLPGVNASQPIVHAGDRNDVFVSTGYGTGAALFEVVHNAAGDFGIQTKWTSRRLKAKFAVPVYRDGCVYGLDDGILACLDIETGKRLWKGGRYGHGQILLVGNDLVVQTEAGDVVLVELTENGPVESGTLDALDSKTWNHPALAGEFLLVRSSREAACYRLSLID